MQVRQGDILIESFDGKLPKDLINAPNNIIAIGEKSGHKHELQNAQLLIPKEPLGNGVIGFAKVDSMAAVIHTTHGKQELPQGTYIFTRQREWPNRDVSD